MRASSRASSDPSVSPSATGSTSVALPGPRPSLPDVQGRTSSVTLGSEGVDELAEAKLLEGVGARAAGLGLPAHPLAVGTDHAVPVLHDADPGVRAVGGGRAVAWRGALERRVEAVAEAEDAELV